MQALANKGVKVIFRRGFVEPGIPAWKRILQKTRNIALNKLKNPFNSFLHFKPGLILYNGTSYTCIEDKQLFETLLETKTPYFYLSHIAADYYRPVGLSDIPVIAKAFKKASANLFVAERTVKITERQIAALIPNKIIVRNPVNLSTINPIPYPNINGKINFATVGLLVAAHKGQDMLFEVLSAESWHRRDWHLNIYGSGVDETYLKQLTVMYGISNKVTFHGKVSDIHSIWELNHMLIMPSLMEGMPLAVVEAMLCARPCLATDVGDHTAWIEDLKEGFIAEAPSPNSISKAMDRAWNNKHNWQQMGTNAHSKALLLYDREPGKKLLHLLTNNLNQDAHR
jgi:glycosyltransferase involved in cell wall biosynthesis